MALKDCGGMWIRQGKKGEFLSGKFQPEGRNGPSYSFMAFENKNARDREPDWRIVMTEDDEQRPTERQERRPSQVDPADDEKPPF